MSFIIIATIAIISLGIIALLLNVTSSGHKGSDGNDYADNVINAGASCATCNGDNKMCEQECMMEAATKEIDYYDDEELDEYAGREGNAYTNEEAEQFREVMYTMRPDEVKGWNRSLILRRINMPDQIKDEAIALMGE